MFGAMPFGPSVDLEPGEVFRGLDNVDRDDIPRSQLFT
jgi:hypothetical protein